MGKVIGIDTNVIVRFLAGDDPEQFATARTLISQNQVFVSDTVLLETEWVLRFAYDFDPSEIIHAFRSFLGLKNVIAENPERLESAIEWHEKGLDFADALHLAACQQYPVFATFDQALCKLAPETSACRPQQLV